MKLLKVISVSGSPWYRTPQPMLDNEEGDQRVWSLSRESAERYTDEEAQYLVSSLRRVPSLKGIEAEEETIQ